MADLKVKSVLLKSKPRDTLSIALNIATVDSTKQNFKLNVRKFYFFSFSFKSIRFFHNFSLSNLLFIHINSTFQNYHMVFRQFKIFNSLRRVIFLFPCVVLGFPPHLMFLRVELANCKQCYLDIVAWSWSIHHEEKVTKAQPMQCTHFSCVDT